MIYGVQLGVSGIDTDGEYLEQQKVTIAVNDSEGDIPFLEVTTPEDTIYSVDLAAFERALGYAKAEHAAAQEEQ